jgi:N-acetylated-alpha-linked acidic dipeptidase
VLFCCPSTALLHVYVLFAASSHVCGVCSSSPPPPQFTHSSLNHHHHRHRHGHYSGSGSDFTGFLQFIGVSCLDLRWEGENRAEGIYHSIYDSNYWIENFGDPTWELLTSLTEVFGRLMINLADAPVIPFRFVEYATDMRTYVEQLDTLATPTDLLDFAPMYEATANFETAARDLDARADRVAANLDQYTELEVRQLSDRLMRVERAFINENVLKDRGLYKHIIFAPGRYDSYAGEAFPSLYDAMRAHDLPEARYQIKLLAGLITEAGEFMESS